MEDKSNQGQVVNAHAEHDVVHILGPAGIDLALTPEAALRIAKRIDEAAVEAIINRSADVCCISK